jgi:hypothetical protein
MYGRHGQTVVARHFGRPTFDVAPPRSNRRHLRHVDNRQTFLLQMWAWHHIGNNGGPLCLTPPKPNSQDLSKMRTIAVNFALGRTVSEISAGETFP